MSVELRFRAIQTLNNFPCGYAIANDKYVVRSENTPRCGNDLCKLQNLAYKIISINEIITIIKNIRCQDYPRALPGSMMKEAVG